MKLYAYRSKTEKDFMICSRTEEGSLRVLKAWFTACKSDFSTYDKKFELITLEVEEEES
mgnify:CR=1 FL=1